MNIKKEFWCMFAKCFPKGGAKILYQHILGKKLDMINPKDLNEKINYLKFHEDMQMWSDLSDKYKVRKYVDSRGLRDILVPLYGYYSTPEELISNWSVFPNSFVLKTNNGCGTVKLILNKNEVEKTELKKIMRNWLKEKSIGIGTIEPHYTLIKPLLIVEKLLKDDTVLSYSRSVIDYKIWCFNGKPYSIFTAYDRSLNHHHVYFDEYDLSWNRVLNAMVMYPEIVLSKPKNFDMMIKYAEILAKGHKQVRVDFYNIEGKIYFGEMTFTAQGGYINYYTPEFLLLMGKQFEVK